MIDFVFGVLFQVRLMLLHSTLQLCTGILKVAGGSFSAPDMTEFVAVRDDSLVLFRVYKATAEDEEDTHETVSTTKLYAVVRDICSFQLPDSAQHLVAVGSDTGCFDLYGYDSAVDQFVQVLRHPYGRIGCRRAVPGQYVLAQPTDATSIMVGALEQSKLIYHLKAGPNNKPEFAGAPQQINLPGVVTYHAVAIPSEAAAPSQYAAIELDTTNGEKQRVLAVYTAAPTQPRPDRVELPLPPSAHRLVALPASSSTKCGDMLVCCDGEILLMNVDTDADDAPSCHLPRRPVFTPEPHAYTAYTNPVATYTVETVTRAMRDGTLFTVLQTEHGDVFRVEYSVSAGVVALTASLIDCLPAARSMAFFRSAIFMASESGPHGLYSVAIGESDPLYTCSSGETPPTMAFTPAHLPLPPAPIHLAALGDPLPNHSPLVKVVPAQPVEGGPPLLLELTGTRHHSMLRVGRRGAMAEVAMEHELEGLEDGEAVTDLWAVQTGAPDTEAAGDVLLAAIRGGVSDAPTYRTIALQLATDEADEAEFVPIDPSDFSLSADRTLAVHSYSDPTRSTRTIIQVCPETIYLTSFIESADGSGEVVESTTLPRDTLTERFGPPAVISCVAADGPHVLLAVGDNRLGLLTLAADGLQLSAVRVGSGLGAGASTVTALALKGDVAAVGDFTGVSVMKLVAEAGRDVTAKPTLETRVDGRVDSLVFGPGSNSLLAATSGEVSVVRYINLENQLNADPIAVVSARTPFKLAAFLGSVMASAGKTYMIATTAGSGIVSAKEVVAPAASAIGIMTAGDDPYLVTASHNAISLMTPTDSDSLVTLASESLTLTPREAVPLTQFVDGVVYYAVLEADQRVVVDPANPEVSARFGHLAAVDGVGSSQVRVIRLKLDSVSNTATLETLAVHPLTPPGQGQGGGDYMSTVATAAARVVFKSRGDGRPCLVVGCVVSTGPYLGRAGFRAKSDETVHKSGLLVTYDIAASDGSVKLTPVHRTGLADPPVALATYSDQILCSAGGVLLQYGFGHTKLLLANAQTRLPHETSGRLGQLAVHNDRRIWAADSQRGWTVIQTHPVTGTFTTIASEQSMRVALCGAVVDRDSIIAADRFGLVYEARVPEALAARLASGGVESKTEWDAAVDDATPVGLLELAHSTHIGDTVTSLSIVPWLGASARDAVIIGSTLNGGIIMFKPIPTEREAQVLRHVQTASARLVSGDRRRYRSVFHPSLNTLDLDLLLKAAALGATEWGEHDMASRGESRDEVLRRIQDKVLAVI